MTYTLHQKTILELYDPAGAVETKEYNGIFLDLKLGDVFKVDQHNLTPRHIRTGLYTVVSRETPTDNHLCINGKEDDQLIKFYRLERNKDKK